MRAMYNDRYRLPWTMHELKINVKLFDLLHLLHNMKQFDAREERSRKHD